MKQLLKMGVVAVALALVFSGVPSVSAQTTDVATDQSQLRALIDSLLAQVQLLQEQVAALTARTEALELSRDLARGDSGEDVELLQQVLATDPTIYPEGLVTGFFGPLTQAALNRLEARYIIEGGTGRADARVRGVINDLLTEGNAAGFVPPGLLTAPGIQNREYEFELEIKDGEIRYKVNSRGRGRDGDDDDDEDEEDDDEDDDDEEDEDEDEEDEDDEDDEDNSGQGNASDNADSATDNSDASSN